MTEMNWKEAVAPWAFIVTGATVLALLTGTDLVAVAYIAPWVGLVASIAYINYRYWGSPLQFTPSLENGGPRR